MIKQIQLRGISRTPSDRMNEDGGVAESLNTYIAEGESAPALPPEDKTEEYGLPKSGYDITKGYVTFRCVYIHRVNNEDHFIYALHKEWFADNVTHHAESLYSYPGEQEVFPEREDVTIIDNSVTSIGNTIVFSTTEGCGYSIYKDGTYHYLGSELPQPQIAAYPNLYTGKAQLNTKVTVYPLNVDAPSDNPDYSLYGKLYEADSDTWADTLSTEDDSPGVRKIATAFWDGMQGLLLKSPYFRYPVAVRFALKLYDGTYIHHTVPILLGGKSKRLFSTVLSYWTLSYDTGALGAAHTYITTSSSDSAYKIFLKLLNAEDFEGWSDVIQSIDMFISAPILYPEINSTIVQATALTSTTETTAEGGKVEIKSMELHFQNPEGGVDESDGYLHSLFDGTRLFYKVKSFPLDNLGTLADGYEQRNTQELSYTENLYTHETLPDDYRSNNYYTSKKNYVINRRLISQGLTETFGRGMESLYGLVPSAVVGRLDTETHKNYQFIYEIKDSDDNLRYVYSRSWMQTPTLQSRSIDSAGSLNFNLSWNSDVRQLIFYPDTRCQAVYVVRDTDGYAVRLEMKSHPYLSCAYYMGDPTKTLSDLTFAEMTLPTEDRKSFSYYYSYLFQSALENPFYFPASGRIKFTATIIAVASISTALSEGQYGQFDLYAFTDTGIWVLTPNDEGVYIKVNPLSRDVCISENTLVNLDQAVVFITERGVMLLDGSKITCLSPNMNGEHYVMEDAAITVLDKVDPDMGYGFALTSGVPFMKFMASADTQIAYDYTGSRLIFFNQSYNYQYVYMLQTNTWHKYVMDRQKNNTETFGLKILNSYPDCYMFCNDNDGTLHLFNWSTVLDVLDKTTEVASVIATRPFDLGETDILKTINHLKIRGHYERYKTLADGTKKPRVSYMLFGSQDGFNFYRLGSLRGKSWKLFRIIILSYLRPTERISYIDIEYETRFTNKLR